MHWAVALGGAQEALAADPALDRGLRDDFAVGALLHEPPPGLEAKQGLIQPSFLAHQQLEGPVGGLKLEALMLELLDPLDHPLGKGIASIPLRKLETSLGCLLDDGALAGELGDEHITGVAHEPPVDLLERLRIGTHTSSVQAGLM